LDVPVEPGSILYLSSGYKWHANVDAAKWLYYEIMPRIWENVPEAKLYISGREPPVEMQRWASERVVLTGFVPDERKLLARANVVVVPMRLGGGIKLRILTALSLGKAVVTTPQGAEGIAGLVDGQHALVRDNAEAFAEAVVEIIRRPELCYQLGIHGRQLMRTFYDWKIVGAQWNDAITKIVEAYS
jgi:glycosyltransferase involved in cell wall biosynthesis